MIIDGWQYHKRVGERIVTWAGITEGCGQFTYPFNRSVECPVLGVIAPVYFSGGI